MQKLEENLKKIMKGEVIGEKDTLYRYSHDASIFEVTPKVVVFPEDSEDIKNLVRFVAGEREKGGRISLSARSGGSDMTGGPLSESIVVDMTKSFDRIKELGDNFAVVEPGVFYRDFEREAAKKNLLFPSYPASRELCTIGGMVANNAGGEKTLAYGKTERYVKEITIVCADGNEYTFSALSLDELEKKKKQENFEGNLYRELHELVKSNYELLQQVKPTVSKNSSGYALWDVFNSDKKIFDLTKVIVGSQGTLGIITQITLTLIRPKPVSQLLVIFLKDMSLLAKVIDEVLKERPESLEAYDDHTFKVALNVFPEIARQLKGNLLRLAFSFLPEFWMAMSGGIPKLVLLAEFTGDTSEEVGRKAHRAKENLSRFALKTKITKTSQEAQKYWLIRRESFNLLRKKIKGMRTVPFIDDVVVRPEDLSVFLPKLYEILSEYDILYTIAGHAGDANFHIIPLMNLADPKVKEIITTLAPKVYQLVFSFHGSMSGEHNDGLIRSSYLKMMYGDNVYQLFERTKEIFDPQGIFNPGKKVGASLGYAIEHIATA